MTQTHIPVEQVLNRLNEAQQKAVVKTDQNLLVLAGAGSGKTRVITAKIFYLIKSLQVPPHRILAITFTNKAANEMKERVAKLLGSEQEESLQIFTFHSLAARMLRRTIEMLGVGYRASFIISDESVQKSLVKKIIGKNLEGEDISADVRKYFGWLKQKVLYPWRRDLDFEAEVEKELSERGVDVRLRKKNH